MSQYALFSCTITDAPSVATEEEERPSVLVAPPLPSLAGCWQDDQSTPVRNFVELVCPAAVTAAPVKANEPYEPRLHEDGEETKVVVKADEPTASPNTIDPLDNEAAVIAFWNGKSVSAHSLLKPTGAESRCVWRAMHPDTLSAVGLKKLIAKQ